jgi:hypothetical protein
MIVRLFHFLPLPRARSLDGEAVKVMSAIASRLALAEVLIELLHC